MPSTVATAVATVARPMLVKSASFSFGRLKALSQCSSVNPDQVKLNLPAGSLKEKTAITTIGISM